MAKDKYFFYYIGNYPIETINNSLAVNIRDIDSKKTLFNAYNEQLRFPFYFGFNWDALKDCLCSLDEWLKEKEIMIIHDELPHLEEKELLIYITMLYDVCELWEKYPDVLNFQVFFPEKDKTTISKILENINSRF
jgi:RNAse (barnase) inhibitor barstar